MDGPPFFLKIRPAFLFSELAGALRACVDKGKIFKSKSEVRSSILLTLNEILNVHKVHVESEQQQRTLNFFVQVWALTIRIVVMKMVPNKVLLSECDYV
jgi:hypothetical protein